MRKNDNPLNLLRPEDPIPTAEEKAVVGAIVGALVDVSESEKINLDAKTISKSVDSVVSAEDPIWLVGAPIDKVPTESLFTGTFFQTESNLELMEYMLSAQGNNTVRTDVPTFIEYINSSGSKTSPRAIFESLAMPDSRHLFETMKKEGVRYPNSSGKDESIMEDLFFSEQILKRIGAKTPETTWISVKEFFEASEKGGQTLVFLISKKTKESGILDTDRLFLRFGRGSLKNIREGDVVRNPIVMAFMNLPALFANAIVARLKKSIGPISKLLSFSEKEKQDSNISVKQMESEMNALQSIVKENSETISKLSGIAHEMMFGELSKLSNSLEDWKIDNKPEIVAKKLSDSFGLAVASRMITSSGFALRKIYEVEKIGTDDTEYTVPFSRDYRGIVQGGELIAITTWTPYRSIKKDLDSGRIKLYDFSVSDNVILEAKRVAEAFSNETGFKDFTLDFLLPSDGIPVFHEINRLEFSGMSHTDVRMLVAFRNAFGYNADMSEFDKFKAAIMKTEIQRLAESLMTGIQGESSEINGSIADLVDIGENLDIDRLAEAVKKVTEIAMQQRDRNEAMETSVNDMLIKLREENEMLQTDQLTKLYNRHRFNVVFDKMVEDFEKEGKTFSMAIIDVDNFKRINDTYSHVVGDSALRHLAKVMMKYFGREQVFRFGGEELVILGQQDIHTLAKYLQTTLDYLNRVKLMYKDSIHIPFTFSGGVTEFKKGDNYDNIYERSDVAMLEAKRAGRNRIIVR